MKLKKVIHPEVTQNLRGDVNYRMVYQQYLKLLKWDDEIRSYYFAPQMGDMISNQIYDQIKDDNNMSHHIAMIARTQKENGNNYYLPRDFARVLAKLDRDIPIDYLPDEFWGYIEFAEGTLFDDTGEVWGAYVYVGKLKNHHSRLMDCDEETKVISLTYVNRNKHVTKFAWPLSNIKMGDLIAGADQKDTNRLVDGTIVEEHIDHSLMLKRSSVIIACLNAVLYVSSEDPELEELKLDSRLTSRERKQRRKEPQSNLCSLPLILVNPNYKSEKHYNKESGWWDSHPRWQRCGPNNSRVKLIWVKAHEKKFNR